MKHISQSNKMINKRLGFQVIEQDLHFCAAEEIQNRFQLHVRAILFAFLFKFKLPIFQANYASLDSLTNERKRSSGDKANTPQ